MNCDIRLCNSEDIGHFSILKPQEGEWFIDIGAHKGDISKKATMIARHLKLVLIEPNPLYFEYITGIFSHTDAYAFNVAVGATDGKDTLKSGDSLFSNYPVGVRYEEEIPVDITTLDKVLSTLGNPKPGFIKIDTEGFEAEVLKGFTKCVPGIKFHIEYHNNLGDIIMEMKKLKIQPLCIEFWEHFDAYYGAIHAISVENIDSLFPSNAGIGLL